MKRPNPVRTAFNRAREYELQARIQAHVAKKLAQSLPSIDSHTPIFGLELGCGTGFLSRLILQQLPESQWLLTDIAPAMIHRTRENLLSAPGAKRNFLVMDAECPCLRTSFDMITASLVFQWFRQPSISMPSIFRLLTPKGRLLFATLGPDTFREWRTLCEQNQVPCGLHHYPDKNFWHDLAVQHGMDLTFSEEYLREVYPSPMAFLKQLKAIGAKTPAPNHKPVAPGVLRHLLVTTSTANQSFTVTHHVYFGTFSHRP
ncbi:MAG: methyltransferase [Magnetococcales bacterium]|nr:methyltransferase [Magnetococcales bacterium]